MNEIVTGLLVAGFFFIVYLIHRLHLQPTRF